MGEIKYNGRTYSGLIQANGCFIDTDNVIASGSYVGNFSYTATQDCCVYTAMAMGNNTGCTMKIDGNDVAGGWNGVGTVISQGLPIFLKKGQTLTISSTYSATTSYFVYGIQQGSPITFLSEYASACYDTNEREVGCWIDGKPIYQKTIYTNNATVNNAVTISVSSLNIDSLVDIKGTYDRIVNWMSPPLHMVYCFDGVESNDEQSFIRYDKDDDNILYRIILANNEATSYQAITIRYTKTTDTAGSGKLTPTGFETHHYSTNEQIVGTWIDGKPLYERTWELTIPNSSGTYIYNEVVANLDIVTHTEYSIYGIGERGDVPWYPQATILFSEQSAIGIEFYFASTNYAGRKIYYTSRYTKTTD